MDNITQSPNVYKELLFLSFDGKSHCQPSITCLIRQISSVRFFSYLSFSLFLFFSFFNTLCYLEQFWVHNKIDKKARRCPTYSCLPQAPRLSTPLNRVECWHRILTKSAVSLGFILGVGPSVGLDKCIMEYISHCSITQSGFIIPHSAYSSLPPLNYQHLLIFFIVSIVLPFPEWNIVVIL